MEEKVAIYVRLSREDEDKVDGNKDSRSIENQIKILSDYSKVQKYYIYKVYIDDGFSGGDMNRPGIQELLEDARKKKFDILLIKDISRLGRVMHQVGYLIEEFFPKNNIRVISLNDNYDSNSYEDDESIVIRNFLNDYYLKEFRKKARMTKVHMAHTMHLNFYPKYGYKFDENRKEIVDEYSANIVKRMFKLVSEGNSSYAVAKIFNAEGIMTKSKYAVEVLKEKPMHKKPADKWCNTMIVKTIRDYEYCGHSINNIESSFQDIVILKNTHEAIIDEDTFKKANEILDQLNSRKNRELNTLSGLLFDVNNRRLCYLKKYYKKGKNYYISKTVPLRVPADILHDLLYADVLKMIKLFTKDKSKLKETFFRKKFGDGNKSNSDLQTKLNKYNDYYAKLIEDYFNKKIEEKVYFEKAELLAKKINLLESQLEQAKTIESDIALFDKKFDEFSKNLKSRPKEKMELIKFFIDKIIVYKGDKPKTFELEIFYKFET